MEFRDMEMSDVVPLADDFAAYFPSPSQSNNLTDDGLTNNNNTHSATSRSESPLDPSILNSGFNLGYNNNNSSQNTITTKPFKKKISKPVQNGGKKTTRFRPCDGCRKRRTKCSMLENSKCCQECSKRNMECKFEFTTDQLTQLPTLKNSMICDNCNHRRTTCIIPRNSNTCTECTLRDLQCKFSDAVNDDAKIRTNIPIRDYDQYNGPTIMKKTLSLQGPKSSKLLGPTSIIEKNLLNFDKNYEDNGGKTNPGNSPTNTIIKKEQIIIDGSIKIRKINNDSFFEIINDNEEFIKLSYQQVDEIEKIVYPYGWNLINLYFKIVHPMLPIISYPVFLEKYSRTHREFDPILLASLYLHAINWWHLDKDLQKKPKPNFLKLERLLLVLYSENLINLPPKFSTCQGLILLINYNFHYTSTNPLLKQNDDWKIVSQLITICEELGLNYNSEDWITVPSWERKLRKLLTWGIILLDKMCSLLEFRPSRINPDNWILNELILQDFQIEDSEEVFIEKTNGENFVLNHGINHKMINKEIDENSIYGNLIYVKMIHLSYHINDLLNEIFNLKSLKFDDFDILLIKSSRLLQNLDEWFKNLPSQIQNSIIINNQISSAPLNLLYYTIKFLIYRRLLNYFIENSSIITTDQYQKFKPIFKKLFKEIQDFNQIFINSLTVEHFTNCFWYSNTTKSFIVVAIITLLMVKITNEELYLDDEYDDEILTKQYHDYRDNLKAIATNFYPAKLALDHIDQFIYTGDNNESLTFIL